LVSVGILVFPALGKEQIESPLIKMQRYGYVCVNTFCGESLRWPNHSDRPVCNVFVQICEDQQKLKHTVALIGAALNALFVQIIDDCQGVGEKPFKT
jgi:hypothetical protein